MLMLEVEGRRLGICLIRNFSALGAPAPAGVSGLRAPLESLKQPTLQVHLTKAAPERAIARSGKP